MHLGVLHVDVIMKMNILNECIELWSAMLGNKVEPPADNYWPVPIPCLKGRRRGTLLAAMKTASLTYPHGHDPFPLLSVPASSPPNHSSPTSLQL